LAVYVIYISLYFSETYMVTDRHYELTYNKFNLY